MMDENNIICLNHKVFLFPVEESCKYLRLFSENQTCTLSYCITCSKRKTYFEVKSFDIDTRKILAWELG